MPSASENQAAATFLLPQRRLARIVVIGAIFLAAFAVRAYKLGNPPLNYHPTRQYRSALIARGLYFRTLDSIPEWEKRVAKSNLAIEPRLEAPIMEYLALLAYRAAGGEHLWIPRLFSSVFWLIGAWFVYAIAKRIVSADAALVVTAFYLFLPAGVRASRAFQRDPLMIMFMLAAIFAIVLYFERPSLRALVVAALVSALSIFVKPLGLFPIFGVYIALAVLKTNVLKAVLNIRFILFAVIAVLPAAVYTLYGMFVTGFLYEQAQRSFLPLLLLHPFFWHGWLYHASQTVGYPALCGALLSLIAFRKSFFRALVIGLWAGYFVFGIVFTTGIHTHRYYQLMLVPIAALSLAPLAETLLTWLRQAPSSRYLRTGAWVVFILGVCLPVQQLVWERGGSSFERTIRLREEIGDAVGHSTKTLILDAAYGKILKYHGEVGGHWWPSLEDFRLPRLQGAPEIGAEERLDEMLEQRQPDFFIIGDMKQYREQTNLRDLLTKRYRAVARTDDYIIFDLRERVDSDPPGVP